MKKSLQKILSLALIGVVALLIIIGRGHFILPANNSTGVVLSEKIVNNKTVDANRTSSDGKLKIFYLDVGQGDAILIETPYGQTILIDGGPNNKVINELGGVMPFWDKHIDMMILTHPHADHLVGLVEVLRRYDVKRVYYTGVAYSTAEYTTWLNEIAQRKLPLYIVKEYSEVDLGADLKLEFVYPLKDLSGKNVPDINNSSIVCLLIYKNEQFIFTGDLQEAGEADLVEADKGDERYDLKSDVLKVGHHGSHTSTSDIFLSAVHPGISVISVGANNTFGHPHLRTVKRLERANVEILRTDQLGTIEIESDGNSVIVNE
ncbi:MAG: ComEC/Rec2 family competence protein [Parcubacteria group bacterium]